MHRVTYLETEVAKHWVEWKYTL